MNDDDTLDITSEVMSDSLTYDDDINDPELIDAYAGLPIDDNTHMGSTEEVPATDHTHDLETCEEVITHDPIDTVEMEISEPNLDGSDQEVPELSVDEYLVFDAEGNMVSHHSNEPQPIEAFGEHQLIAPLSNQLTVSTGEWTNIPSGGWTSPCSKTVPRLCSPETGPLGMVWSRLDKLMPKPSPAMWAGHFLAMSPGSAPALA